MEEPFIHLSLDDVWPKLPEKIVGQDEFWKKFQLGKYVSGFHHSIAGYSSAGVGVIIDHCCTSPNGIKECIELFDETRVVFVEVKCSVEKLRDREKERGDRMVGQAESQIPTFETFKENHIYDLEVDTSTYKPDECARIVIDILDGNKPTAFYIMRKDKNDC